MLSLLWFIWEELVKSKFGWLLIFSALLFIFSFNKLLLSVLSLFSLLTLKILFSFSFTSVWLNKNFLSLLFFLIYLKLLLLIFILFCGWRLLEIKLLFELLSIFNLLGTLSIDDDPTPFLLIFPDFKNLFLWFLEDTLPSFILLLPEKKFCCLKNGKLSLW